MSLLALLVLLSQEPVAITGARIVPGDGPEIASGTILIRDGKIAGIGADVAVPEGARVVKADGWTALPGLVHAASRLGAGRTDGGGPGTTPQHRAADDINPALDVYGEAARTGFTLFGISPAGGVVAGQGAVLRPFDRERERRMVEPAAFLRIGMQASTPAKEALRQFLESGKRAVESAKKTPVDKLDERSRVALRFVTGDLPALVSVDGPGEVLHFWQLLDAAGAPKARVTFLATTDVYRAAEALGRRKARVLMRPEMAYAPLTRDRVNAAAELHRAGAIVGFVALSDAPEALEAQLFRAGELVKAGFPRDAALRALTRVPAEALGLEARTGSLEKGKDADLLLFDGDPFAPTSRLRRVFLEGREAFTEN